MAGSSKTYTYFVFSLWRQAETVIEVGYTIDLCDRDPGFFREIPQLIFRKITEPILDFVENPYEVSFDFRKF